MSGGARTWLLDASIYIFRAWFSLPDRWHGAGGQPLNAVHGYAAFLADFVGAVAASGTVAAAFDESLGSCFRHELSPGYKCRRELPDAALAFQLQSCRELTRRVGIACFGGPRYEADDYIATLARLSRSQGRPVTVVSRDKDLGQLLLAPGDRWCDFPAGSELDAAGVRERFGVEPGQLADYLALVGDPVDDIPGVPGVGPKTAARLLREYGDLEHLGRSLDAVGGLALRGAPRIAAALAEHWPQVLLARRLTGLESRIAGVDELPRFQPRAECVSAAGEWLVGLGLPASMGRRYGRLAAGLAA